VERKTLTPDQVMQRIIRGGRLQERFADGLHEQIIYTDESNFCIEQHHNPQNDRTWSATAPPLERRVVWRDLNPPWVMIWGAIGHNFKSELYVVPQGLKIKTREYLIHGAVRGGGQEEEGLR
jgi:hypothetical protein